MAGPDRCRRVRALFRNSAPALERRALGMGRGVRILRCQARTPVLVTALGRPQASGPRSEAGIPLRIVFRRLFFDGYAVGKVELGIQAPSFSESKLSLGDYM